MPGLIISVKEARKLLGKKYDHMTDEQIEDMIVQLDEIARLSIKQSLEKLKGSGTVAK
jgi:hypothetical protein